MTNNEAVGADEIEHIINQVKAERHNSNKNNKNAKTCAAAYHVDTNDVSLHVD